MKINKLERLAEWQEIRRKLADSSCESLRKIHQAVVELARRIKNDGGVPTAVREVYPLPDVETLPEEYRQNPDLVYQVSPAKFLADGGKYLTDSRGYPLKVEVSRQTIDPYKGAMVLQTCADLSAKVIVMLEDIERRLEEGLENDPDLSPIASLPIPEDPGAVYAEQSYQLHGGAMVNGSSGEEDDSGEEDELMFEPDEDIFR